MNPLLLTLFGWLFDAARMRPENDRALAQRDQTTSQVADAQQGVQAASTTGPSVHFGTENFGGSGPNINLNKLFNVGQSSLDAFNKERPNTDIGALRLDPASTLNNQLTTIGGAQGDINSILAGAKVGNLLDGIKLPDADLSDVLRNDLGQISKASQTREDIQRGNVAANASAFGGLEGARRESDNVGFSEGANRGMASNQALSDTRQREVGIEEFNAQTQLDAAKQQAAINASLAQTGANSRLGLADMTDRAYGADWDRQYNLGTFNKGIETGNMARNLDMFLKKIGLTGEAAEDKLKAGLLALQTGQQQQGVNSNAASQILSSELGLGNIMQPFMDTQILSMLSAMQPIIAAKSAPSYDPGNSFGLSVLGTGFNVGGV